MWDQKISDKNVSVIEGTGNSSGLSANLHEKKEFDTNQELDSGFLSGPQTYYSSESAIEIDEELPSKESYQQPDLSSQSYIDSGVIEDEEFSHSSTLDKDPKQSSHMFVDGGVDVGLSEWFCNLNLKNSSQPLNNLGLKSDRKAALQEHYLIKKSKEIHAQLWKSCYHQGEEGDTKLHIAIISDYKAHIIWAMIKLAPYPWLLDIKNDVAQAPIHLAVMTGQSNIVRHLLIAGAKASNRDGDGNTPLHLACINNDLSSIQALTLPISEKEVEEAYRYSDAERHPCAQLPADLDQRNFDGENCVHIAAHRNQINILKHLVWFGADINAREGKAGYTPLHIAIQYNNVELVKFLLNECKKINVEVPTYGRLTPYQLASELEHHKIVKLLAEFGCRQLACPVYDSDSDVEFD